MDFEVIHPGALLIRHFLPPERQQGWVRDSETLGRQPAGFYVPVVRGGGMMHVQMVCLGRHWNPKTYRYEGLRSDHDGLPVQPIPPHWHGTVREAAVLAGMEIQPDICILNRYDENGRMGLHQDKDESRESIDAGIPVVSFSLGCSAVFRLGGFKRKDPVQSLILESGDAFVMGGPSRLRYHGVARIIPGTAPPPLPPESRYNLTFRQF